MVSVSKNETILENEAKLPEAALEKTAQQPTTNEYDINGIDDLDYQILGGAGIDEVSELYPSLSREAIEQRFELIAKFMWYGDDD